MSIKFHQFQTQRFRHQIFQLLFPHCRNMSVNRWEITYVNIKLCQMTNLKRWKRWWWWWDKGRLDFWFSCVCKRSNGIKYFFLMFRQPFCLTLKAEKAKGTFLTIKAMKERNRGEGEEVLVAKTFTTCYANSVLWGTHPYSHGPFSDTCLWRRMYENMFHTKCMTKQCDVKSHNSTSTSLKLQNISSLVGV